MQTADFSKPIRQSAKGIVIIFAFNTFKFFKRFFVLFLAFGLSLIRKKELFNISPLSLVLIIIGILILLLVFAILKYLNFKFHLSKDDFYLSTGIINKDHTIIPKSKIQNVYIKQNFLQQIINVVSINIETAGDNTSEIEISALDKAKALQLKRELFQKTQISENSVQDSVETKGDVFFKVSPKRLILEGISQNHLRSFTIIASFVFGLYYEFKDYVKTYKIKERLDTFIDLSEDTIANIILTNLFIVILVVLFSLLFSVVKTFVANFGLEVVENRKTIEINKGLFNKVSLSLTPTRIQNIVIKTNRVKKYFGLHTMSVKQAMVNEKQHKSFVIIALEKAQVRHLINKLLTNYSEDTVPYKPLLFYSRVLALRMLLLAILLNIITFFVFGNGMWWINLVLIPITVLYSYFGYKKAFYKIDDNFITIGSGVIETTLNILEIHKIQSVSLKQNIFQKRKQIASLEIATASKSVEIPYIDIKQAKYIYNFLLFKVESQDRDWM